MTKIFMMNHNVILFLLMTSLILISMTLNNKNVHPTFLGANLMLFSIILSMNLSISFLNHWFSFIMFLTVISGLMILFMYFISFINNMKMSIKMNSILNMILMNFILTILFFIIMWINKENFMLWMNSFPIEISSMSNNFKLNSMKNFMSINFIYSFNKYLPTLISMIYLFLCLTMIVKICLKNKYSIRKMN